jgi:hypothetical protein
MARGGYVKSLDGTLFLFSDPASSQGVVFGFTTWDVPGARPTGSRGAA